MQQKASDMYNVFGTKMGNRPRAFEKRNICTYGRRSERMENNMQRGVAFSH
jgi:hypothetical protein